MTGHLRDLLEEYGVLVVSLGQLVRERPGSPHETLDAYYESLGGLLPDEPALVVRISKDREVHFLKEGEHDVTFKDEEGNHTGVITVWELPEQEFWEINGQHTYCSIFWG
jgi:hypothetical protein